MIMKKVVRTKRPVTALAQTLTSAAKMILQMCEVSPDLLVRVLVELVANYWSWPGGGGGGVQPRNPRTS